MKFKKFTLLLILLVFVSCDKSKKSDNKSDEQVTENKYKKEKETFLKGQFTIGMTQEDKSKLSGRSMTMKKAMVNSLSDLEFTFYGNGKGIGFLDDGSRKYITEKIIDNNKFRYEVNNDSIYMTTKDDSWFFAKIIERSIKNDYFVIDLEGENKIKTRFALYKVGEAPEKPIY